LNTKNGDHVAHAGKHHRLQGLENTGGHHGCDGIGGVMKPIHEVERQRQQHQRHHTPKTDL